MAFIIPLSKTTELNVTKLVEITRKHYFLRHKFFGEPAITGLFIKLLRTVKRANYYYSEMRYWDIRHDTACRRISTYYTAMQKIIEMNPESPEAGICRAAIARQQRQERLGFNRATRMKKTIEEDFKFSISPPAQTGNSDARSGNRNMK